MSEGHDEIVCGAWGVSMIDRVFCVDYQICYYGPALSAKSNSGASRFGHGAGLPSVKPILNNPFAKGDCYNYHYDQRGN